jgi:hypothetical protein
MTCFTAITDYKIEMAKKVKQYYKADILQIMMILRRKEVVMSPETYRKTY